MDKDSVKLKYDLQPGDMIIYPFLWGWEKSKGKAKAHKMRPAMVIYRIEQEGEDPVLAILPITTQPTNDMNLRIPIPKREMLRVGMDTRRPQSLCLHDCNMEVIRTSETLSRIVPIRNFSDSLVTMAQKRFRKSFAMGKVAVIDRSKIKVPSCNVTECEATEVAGP